jgi:hypothetical protein
MTSHRIARRVACATAALLACLLSVHAAAAQSFVEFGGGWNYRQSAPANDSYSAALNGRLSAGGRVSDNLLLRFDLFDAQYDRNDRAVALPPCPVEGCSSPAVPRLTTSVAGLTVNGIAELDRRGIVYLIGGAGLDEAFGHGTTSFSETHLGVSFGAGVAVPIGNRLRAVLETQFHSMLGPTSGTPWFLPITIGVRY